MALSRMEWKDYVANHCGLLDQKLDGMAFIAGHVLRLYPHQLLKSSGRAVVSLFYDAFDQFLEAAYWYLNAFYKLGVEPGPGSRQAIMRRAENKLGLPLVQNLLAKWPNERKRRNLLHHNSGTTFAIEAGTAGLHVRFQDDIDLLENRLRDQSLQIAERGYWEAPEIHDMPTSAYTVDVHLMEILEDCRTLVADLTALTGE